MSAIINFREKLSRCKHWKGEHYGASGTEKILKVAGPTPGKCFRESQSQTELHQTQT